MAQWKKYGLAIEQSPAERPPPPDDPAPRRLPHFEGAAAHGWQDTANWAWEARLPDHFRFGFEITDEITLLNGPGKVFPPVCGTAQGSFCQARPRLPALITGFLVSAMPSLFTRIKRHPFPVVAHFERVMAVSFAFPESLLRPLAPAPLELDTFEGWGFVTAALVWTRGLRPVFLPRFAGQDFFLAGYRVFTRLRDTDGRRLRGLKILRSETDKASMVWSGNLLTHYNYRRVDVKEERNASHWRVGTQIPGGARTLDLTFDLEAEVATPPQGSPFADWRTARRFAGPMPFTFDHEGDGRFVIIEGRRAEWTPRPVAVKDWSVALFDEPPFRGTAPVLANAFTVENISYRWERGRVVTPGKDGGHA